jgi:hypothetical protein
MRSMIRKLTYRGRRRGDRALSIRAADLRGKGGTR